MRRRFLLKRLLRPGETFAAVAASSERARTGRSNRIFARYFWQNTQQTDEYKVDEAHFIYDIEDKLARIETDSCVITFYYNEEGLPTSSMGISKFDGQKMQYMIFYDYEFRDGSSVAKRN